MGGSGRGWRWVLDPDCGFLPWVEREGGWRRGGARRCGCSALDRRKIPSPVGVSTLGVGWGPGVHFHVQLRVGSEL